MSDETRTESPAWTLPAIIVLGLLAIGGLAFGWNASSKLDATQQSVATQLKTAEQAAQQDKTRGGCRAKTPLTHKLFPPSKWFF